MTQRAVTSHDVAAAAGVSQATVSRVLQGDPRVRPETRARVLEACDRLNYRPNALARAMRGQRTGVLGLVVADIHNPFYSEAIEAFSTAVAQTGRSIVIWNADSDDAAIRATQERLIDGLIFTTALPTSSLLRSVIADKVPVVLFNRGLPSVRCSQVISANREGGARAAEYLISQGRRRLAIVHGAPSISTTSDRAAGFLARAAELGVPIESGYRVEKGMSRAAGWSATQELLALDEPPDAIFCTTDIAALGAIDSARGLGIRVPEDLWVVGFDDIPLASWEAYSLTTFAQPIDKMVPYALELLDRHIADPSAEPEIVVVDNPLVVRGSTAHAE